jgi:hypothetical protein
MPAIMGETCGQVKPSRSQLIGGFEVNDCGIRVTGRILTQETVVREPYVCMGARKEEGAADSGAQRFRYFTTASVREWTWSFS